MEYKASMEINVIVCCVILCYVSPQTITTDNKLCSKDDGVDREKDIDYLIQVIKQQAIQIQELSEKFLAQEALLKNISETLYPVQTKEIKEESIHYNGSIPGQFGRDFILSFPYLREVNDITLLLVSQTNTTVSIRSVVPGVNRTVSFSSSKGTSISLPTSLIRNGSYVGNNTVSLHSDVEIAVFVLLTGLSDTGDGYIAIPRKRLRQRYHFSMNHYGVLSFVSFYDETVITISNSTGQIVNLQTFGSSQSNTITLQKEEVLQLRFNGFVIGTVEGSKPFMALHGSHLDNIYSTYQTSYIDAISDSEGSVFIIPYLSTATDSMTICNAHESSVALSDVTVERFLHNYRIIRRFDKATFMIIDLRTTCHYIGHGFSVTIPSVQSYTTYCRFLTPIHNNYTHHAAVMIQSDLNDDLQFSNIENGKLLTPYKAERTTAGGTMYDVLYYHLDVGQYEVFHETSDVQFGVITYGFGTDKQIAYGYPACFR